MLRVLQAAFTGSFEDRFALGALVAFLTTVADRGLFNIGAAFWGFGGWFRRVMVSGAGDFSPGH